MQKYIDVVQKRSGAAVGGASVTVYTSGGSTLASIYDSDSTSDAKANPITTNDDGEYYFYAANGVYTIVVSAPGFTSETTTDVRLYDPTCPTSETASVTSVATGLQTFSQLLDVTYSPSSAPDQTTIFGACHKYTYSTTQSNSGAGHYGAALAWYRHNGTGDPNYAIAHEGKWEGLEAGATVALASSYDGQLNGVGTITVANITQGRVVSHSGEITNARGLYSQCETDGTVTSWFGHYNGSKTGTGTVTNNWAVYNEDATAGIFSAGPICDGTLQYETPLAGATVTISDNVTTLLIEPAGTIATLTVNLPANPREGQKAEICATQIVTALTLGGNGNTVRNAITTLAAGGAATYKCYAAGNLWYRVA